MSNNSGEELLRNSQLNLPNINNARNGGSLISPGSLTIEDVADSNFSQRSKNVLPEDQEIIEEEEEEEEDV
jgi:hypothetical protein